jgi:hypothetical protein
VIFWEIKKHKSSIAFADKEIFNTGDIIQIQVDEINPLNIVIAVIDDHTLAYLLCINAILFIIMTTSVQFIKF